MFSLKGKVELNCVLSINSSICACPFFNGFSQSALNPPTHVRSMLSSRRAMATMTRTSFLEHVNQGPLGCQRILASSGRSPGRYSETVDPLLPTWTPGHCGSTRRAGFGRRTRRDATGGVPSWGHTGVAGGC